MAYRPHYLIDMTIERAVLNATAKGSMAYSADGGLGVRQNT